MSPSRGVGLIAAMRTGLQRTPLMANPAMLGRPFSNRRWTKTKSDISAGTRKVALGVKADDLFCKIGGLFYARFEKEAVIDARKTEVRNKSGDFTRSGFRYSNKSPHRISSTTFPTPLP